MVTISHNSGMRMTNTNYDYIIAGAGLAGLSLAYRMIHSPLAEKRILLLDQSFEITGDKTWSFWHAGTPPFEAMIHKSWDKVQVHFPNDTNGDVLREYTYHSIKSGVFRAQILDALRAHPAVELREAAIAGISGNETEATLQTDKETFTASYIFQSCLVPPALTEDPAHYPLIQHFLGHEVETTTPVFDPTTVTLMDFDPEFTDGIAFIYILPFTDKKALVEYTIFSDTLEKRSFYKEKLSVYMNNKFGLRPLDYSIQRAEYGEIPMQDQVYVPWYAPRVLNMGVVGGLTKPSTGYTFSRIQQHADAIIRELQASRSPALPMRSPFRYRAYDLWLLQIIHDHPQQAYTIFHQLFSNNSVDDVFRFLAEENTRWQDFKTMSKVSYPPFFRAMWQTKGRLFEL